MYDDEVELFLDGGVFVIGFSFPVVPKGSLKSMHFMH